MSQGPLGPDRLADRASGSGVTCAPMVPRRTGAATVKPSLAVSKQDSGVLSTWTSLQFSDADLKETDATRNAGTKRALADVSPDADADTDVREDHSSAADQANGGAEHRFVKKQFQNKEAQRRYRWGSTRMGISGVLILTDSPDW
jgi:hypothetical protein